MYDRILRMLEETERRVDKQCVPMGKLAWSILEASINCRDSVKPVIRISESCAPLEQEAYIFFEYAYLFTHLAMRDAIGALPMSLLGEVQQYVTTLVSKVAVGMYFEHWSSERKEAINKQFVEKLNEREAEFSEVLRTAENELHVLDNFISVAAQVTNLCQQDDNWEHMKQPMLATMLVEWKKAGFTDHLANIF